MKKQNEEYTLITGIFKPADALSVVSKLFGDKIEYHNRNILRAHEGFGNVDQQEVDRVNVLKNSRHAFQQSMQEAEALGYVVSIESIIHIEFKKV